MVVVAFCGVADLAYFGFARVEKVFDFARIHDVHCNKDGVGFAKHRRRRLLPGSNSL